MSAAAAADAVLPPRAESVVFALHKPRKLTIARLPERKSGSGVAGRRGCFSSWLSELEIEAGLSNRSLFPIGRLDKETRGLLLVTNDGDLAYVLTRQGVCRKRYVARCRVMDASLKAALNNQTQHMGDGEASHADSWSSFAALVRKQLCEDGISLSDQRPNSSRTADPIAVHFSSTDVIDVRIQRRSVPMPQPNAVISRKERRKSAMQSVRYSRENNTLLESSVAYSTQVADGCKSLMATSPDASSQQCGDMPQQVFEHIEVDVAVDVTVGQYRVVRRALAAIGLPVFTLSRSAVGPLELQELGIDESSHMRLGDAAVAQLWQSVGGRSAVDTYKAEDKEAARAGYGDFSAEFD